MEVLNNAMILCMAHFVVEDKKYLTMAQNQLHYILGRNALDVSYVTGHEEKAFQNPHNRPTDSDDVEEPIPGYVSGGPNGKPCDDVACRLIPEGTPGMKCYLDHVGSYSTNEITIYWNSPLVFTLAYLECNR